MLLHFESYDLNLYYSFTTQVDDMHSLATMCWTPLRPCSRVNFRRRILLLCMYSIINIRLRWWIHSTESIVH